MPFARSQRALKNIPYKYPCCAGIDGTLGRTCLFRCSGMPFSSGGMVITGAADHMPERIAHLVFLDAFVSTCSPNLIATLAVLRDSP
jgi:hypothetical protein